MASNNIAFNLDKASELYNSHDPFPVSFEDAWEWLGYSKKAHGKRAFLTFGFIENVDFQVLKFTTKGNGRPAETIVMTVDCFERWKMQMGSSIKSRKENIRNHEITCVKALHIELGGTREVLTPAGKIDLLTSIEIIEVKSVKGWKSGLGQLLVYGVHYPSHQKRLHLFGACTQSYLDLVEKYCKRYKIKLTHNS